MLNKNEENDEETVIPQYQLLGPKDDLENIELEQEFDLALSNDKILNFAVMGSYSSGKSSAILSYFNKRNLKDENKINYINISLAKLVEQSEEIKSEDIEKSIIEKIFYMIKTKEFKVNRLSLSIAITLILYLLFFCFDYNFIYTLIHFRTYGKLYNTIKILLCTILFPVLSMFIYNMLKILNHLEIVHIKVSELELEISGTQDNSIRNSLFISNFNFIKNKIEKGNIDLIIFEDIDRFENIEVFNNLRDLNVTLNKVLDRKIKFLYVVKEDLFLASSKCKFFDYIIPIVPYSAYGNAGDLLNKVIKDNGLSDLIDEYFIYDITAYVTDIRILNNTYNEFLVYKKKLHKTLTKYDNLFAIILYKNLFPKDFIALQERDGILFYLLNNNSSLKKIKTIKNDKKYKNNPEINNFIKYEKLIEYLIKNKYITQDYYIYLYIFYEYMITENENIFLINAIEEKDNDFEQVLENPGRIITRIRDENFKKNYTLNMYILDELLNLANNSNNKKIIYNIKALCNSPQFTTYIVKCMESNDFKNKNLLIKAISDFNDIFLLNLLNNGICNELIICILLTKPLNSINTNWIKKYIAENNYCFSDYIINQINTINIRFDYNNIKILKNDKQLLAFNKCSVRDFILNNNIKYTNICNFNSEYSNFVIKNQLYEINLSNILKIESEYYKRDISSNILQAVEDNPYTNEYIKSNLNIFMKNVYSLLNNMQSIDENRIIKYINYDDNYFNKESKSILISKSDFKINNILDIKNKEIWSQLYKENKVFATYNNIINYSKYIDEKEALLIYLAYPDNVKLIQNSSEKNIINNDIKNLLYLINDLDIIKYEQIISKLKISELNFNKIHSDKILFLIDNNKLELNTYNINALYSYSKEFFSRYINKYVDKLLFAINNKQILLSHNEIIKLLSTRIKNDNKNSLYVKSLFELLYERKISSILNSDASILSKSIIKTNQNNLVKSQELLINILKEEKDDNIKMLIVAKNLNLLKQTPQNILGLFKNDLKDILIKNNKVRLNNSKERTCILNYLIQSGYINKDRMIKLKKK